MEYITEIIIGALALVGTLGGSYLSNRKNAAVITYRLEQLEKRWTGTTALRSGCRWWRSR